MRRRWVLAIVTVTALVFLLAGTAVGYYVVPRSKSDSAECIILARDLSKATFWNPGGGGFSGEDAQKIVIALYNEHCR